jgi:hypothetical protein
MSKVKPNVEEEKLQQLEGLLEAAKTARPSPADEERMAALVCEFLLGNKAAVTLGTDSLLQLPWSLAVKATAEAWPNLKPTGRKQILAALDAATTEEARRIRLSLARGLTALDAESAHKVLQSVCAAILPETDSLLTNKDRQGIFNVLIGKGKPWLQHLDLTGWSPDEQLLFARCVLQAAPVSAPFTQEAILRWASALGVLEKLPPVSIEMLVNMLNRWPTKLRRELEKLPTPLPEAITSQLKQLTEPPKPAPQREPQPASESEPEAPDSHSRRADSTRQRPEQRPTPRTTVINVPRQPAEARAQSVPPPNARPAREQEFDLTTSLRQIEQYVLRLRKDVREAQSVREPREARGRRRSDEPVRTSSSGETESIQRHNAQLEATVAELRERIEDLVQDHEDRAVTMEQGDPVTQFKHLMGLKLKDSFAEYFALRGQTPNDVLRQHYGDLLGQVFEILQEEGVDLKAQ